MTVLLIIGTVILAILLLAAFVLSLRLTLTVIYDGELALTLRILFVKIKLYPKDEKQKRIRSMSAAKAARIRKAERKRALKERERLLAKRKERLRKKRRKKALKKQKTFTQRIRDFADNFKLISGVVITVIKRFSKHIKVNVHKLRIKVASSDASTTAIAYGSIVQTVNALLPVLEETKAFTLPQNAEDLNVRADFTDDTPEIDLKISLSLRVWHILDIILTGLRKAMPTLEKRSRSQGKAQHKFKNKKASKKRKLS